MAQWICSSFVDQAAPTLLPKQLWPTSAGKHKQLELSLKENTTTTVRIIWERAEWQVEENT